MIDISGSVKTVANRASLYLLADTRAREASILAIGATTANLNVSWAKRDSDADPVSVIMRLIMDAQGNTKASVFAPGASVSGGTGDGNDTITVDAGEVSAFGAGGGNDLIAIRASGRGERTVDLVNGNSGDDRILISSAGGVDRTEGGDGDDTIAISSQTKVDRTEGGAGNDRLMLASTNGVDRAYGNAGDDDITIEVGGSAMRVDGGDGNDTIAVSGKSAFSIAGGNGNDRISIATGNATLITGGEGDDSIAISAQVAAYIYGGDGDDTIRISADSIKDVRGGAGDDRIALDSTAGRAATVVFAEGDGKDVVETNGPLAIRWTSADGTRSLDAASATVSHNDDGTVTVGLGGEDSITLRFTGDMAGREVKAGIVDGMLTFSGVEAAA